MRGDTDMARKDNKHVTGALTVFGAGVVGAGLALLLAPNSGRKTRRDIAYLTRKTGTKADRAVRELAENCAEFADSMGKKATGIYNDGQKLTQKSKKQLFAAFEKGQKKLAKQRQVCKG
jgi:gas vesicle protein